MTPCTTGVQTAQIAIDWLQWTYPADASVAAIRDAFNGPGGWAVLPQAMHGYRQALRRGDLWLLYDGSKGMGPHVQASGKGCDQLAQEGAIGDWPTFLGSLLADDVHFSRIDVALDDLRGVLSLPKIRRCMERGLVVSRWRQATSLKNCKLTGTGSEVKGRSVVFGSPQSEGRVHIYDKALEQGLSGPWVRVELQCRGERAQALVRAISEGGEQVVPGVLRSYLSFKRPGRQQQRDRWPVQPWWEEFLGDCAKMRLSTDPGNGKCDDFKWLWRTAAPALARLEATYGIEAVYALIEHGRARAIGNRGSQEVFGKAGSI